MSVGLSEQTQTKARLAQASSRSLHTPSLEFEILGRNDSYALQRRPKMLADRKTAIARLVRIGERLMEAGHSLEDVAAALESISLHPADLLAGLAVPRDAVTERLREHYRGLLEIIRVNESACAIGKAVAK
jgi:hypothetical protein